MAILHTDLHSTHAEAASARGSTDVAPVVYIVHRESCSSVLDAMVLKPLESLRRAGVPVELLLFVPVGRRVRPGLRSRWTQRLASMRTVFRGEITVLSSPPTRWRSLWNECRTLTRWLRSKFGDRACVILHGRGEQAARIALAARNDMPELRVLYDMRGVHHAELLYDAGCHSVSGAPPNVTARVNAIRDVEAAAAVGCDRLVCVSQKMAEYAAHEYDVPADKIDVLWNHVPVESHAIDAFARRAIREALMLGGRFVVGYAGSLYARQRPEQGVALVQLFKKLEPRTHFLVLTEQRESMEKLLDGAGFGPDDATVLSVAQQDVPHYLAAMDVGLIATGLFERPCLANAVCAPVKFAEYLAAGCPVVMSGDIGDYSELVTEAEVGLVLPHSLSPAETEAKLMGLLEQIRDGGHELRARCRDLAVQKLSTESALARLVEHYRELSRAKEGVLIHSDVSAESAASAGELVPHVG